MTNTHGCQWKINKNEEELPKKLYLTECGLFLDNWDGGQWQDKMHFCWNCNKQIIRTWENS